MITSSHYYIKVYTRPYVYQTHEFKKHWKAQAFLTTMEVLVEKEVIHKVEALTGQEMIANEIDINLSRAR